MRVVDTNVEIYGIPTTSYQVLQICGMNDRLGQSKSKGKNMECPECQSKHIRKNGRRRGKQNHICVNCGRQFVSNPQTQLGYSDDARLICLKMYVNGMGFRGIERVTGIHHTTVI